MGMALLETTGGDAHKGAFGAEVGKVFGTEVAHAGAQASNKLEDDIAQVATERDAAFDAFCDEFPRGVLAVTVAGALAHGFEAAHAAVFFKCPSLIVYQIPRTFHRARQQRTQHDDVRTGGQCFDDVPGIADATIGNGRHAVLAADAAYLLDGGELGHTNTGNNAGGADGTRTNANLDGGGTAGNEIARTPARSPHFLR